MSRRVGPLLGHDRRDSVDEVSKRVIGQPAVR
jgi:hypothetical protein